MHMVWVSPDQFAQCRLAFAVVNDKAPNRLIIGTFLGGFTLATFAVRGPILPPLKPTTLGWLSALFHLAGRPIDAGWLVDAGWLANWLGFGLSVVVDLILGSASVLLLATVYFTYTALRGLDGLQPDDRDKLNGSEGLPGATGAGATAPNHLTDSTSISDDTVRILQTSVRKYERPRDFITWSVLLLWFDLALIGFQISPLEGVLILVASAWLYFLVRGLRKDVGAHFSNRLPWLLNWPKAPAVADHADQRRRGRAEHRYVRDRRKWRSDKRLTDRLPWLRARR
jgi:hypothetical protein